MRKNQIFITSFLWLLICVCPVLQGSIRDDVQKTYTSQIGVREKTGNNDGKEVEMYLASVGLDKGNPWCAAYVSWCFQQNNVKCPRSGYSPYWFVTNVIYKRGKTPEVVFPKASVFGIWFESKGRVAHVGYVDQDKGKEIVTVEGNTNSGGSRDGDGCWKRIRLKRQIYIVSDWVK